MLTHSSVRALLAAFVLAACNGYNQPPVSEEKAAPAPVADVEEQQCKPLETRNANADDQKPAFAGQTRACAAPSTTSARRC